MYGLYKEKHKLESKLLSVSVQHDAHYHVHNRHGCKLHEVENGKKASDVTHDAEYHFDNTHGCNLDEVENGKKATDVSNLELLHKEMNELKVKAKVYDTFFMGSTCLIFVLMVLVGALIVVSLTK